VILQQWGNEWLTMVFLSAEEVAALGLEEELQP
jgi:hypothetical protein